MNEDDCSYSKLSLILQLMSSIYSSVQKHRNTSQEIQSDHRTDSDPIEFHLISVKPMKSSWYRSHRTTFGSLMLKSYENVVSETDETQCNVVANSIGSSTE